MVPDIFSLTRRQLLGGLAGGAGLAGAGTFTLGVTAPTALPDIVTDWWVSVTATPPSASDLWRPTVTESHASEAVTLLAETVTKNSESWAEIDSEPSRAHVGGGWLEAAREALSNENYAEALFDATYGLQIAGSTLGRARSIRETIDLQASAERGATLLDRVDAVIAEIEDYPVSEPQRDLAWYARIEGELQRARRLADWHGMDAVLEAGEETVTSGDRADGDRIVENLLLAEIAVMNAERYQTLLFEKLDSAPTANAERLRTSAGALRDALDGMPSQDAVRSRYLDDDLDSYGPYEFAHSRLASWCFSYSGPDPFRTTVDETFRVLTVLGLARGLGRWRAHEAVVEEMVIDPDDEGLDSGHVLAEKRRAQSTFESVVGSNPPPLFTVLVERAIEDIRVADIDRDWDGDWKPWQERVQAYLYALLGRRKLDVYADIYDEYLLVET